MSVVETMSVTIGNSIVFSDLPNGMKAQSKRPVSPPSPVSEPEHRIELGFEGRFGE
jgi:hypothetical protein